MPDPVWLLAGILGYGAAVIVAGLWIERRNSPPE